MRRGADTHPNAWLTARLICVIAAFRCARSERRVLASLVAALIVLAGFVGAGPASATTIYTYDAPNYVYHAPAQLSPPDTAQEVSRGSSERPEAVWWANPVSVRIRGVAANTGGGGFLSRLRPINWADDTGSISLPGDRLRPNHAAEGSHSTFRRGQTAT